MKITILVQQRGKDYTDWFEIPNRALLAPDEELYSSLKDWFGRQIYEAHKRELKRIGCGF